MGKKGGKRRKKCGEWGKMVVKGENREKCRKEKRQKGEKRKKEVEK